MASDRQSAPGPTFPMGLLFGVLAAVVVIVVAWIAIGAEAAIPVTILVVICAAVAFAYRIAQTRGAEGAADSNEGGLPTLPAEESRPLGDTPDAHDEINPHDLPPDHPGRRAAEEMSQGDGETSGMTEGGAAGAGGSEQGATQVPVDEAHGGARTTD